MRLRFNKDASTNLQNDTKFFINTEELSQINPNTYFADVNKPVYLEIGSGKGNFIINNALTYPENNYIGLEKFDTVLWKAMRKAQTHEDLNNLKLMSYDAVKIDELFAPHSISKLFLNFSDPWPKARHAKRRLTHPDFLEKYKKILKADGLVQFKTDNDGLFTWTMEEVLLAHPEAYEIVYHTTDLYQDLNNPYNVNNIPTEYETKFYNLGKNINKVIFRFK
ncbi:tRNA (guanosine(46)-N7)-methyltransferase TrmB [Ureaplasma ceti]|uniref:tRNA (guanine-N(7)-)-methyltransferase n=1 Tax=Ureaplasma ceti TaxID=3119530 RepID=A0ABP9UB66_9BACT